jgi:hypothetical protein
MGDLTYEDLVARDAERKQAWLDSVTQQTIAHHDAMVPPQDPPPPSPPPADAPTRDLLNWWRQRASGDFFAGYLFAAINKMLDENDALRRRVELLEATASSE